MTMKLSATVWCLALCVPNAACTQEPKVRNLGMCWNINTAGFGPVTGEGVFTSSMEGYGFNAPECDDRDGHNSYELSEEAERELREFEGRQVVRPRHLQFSFSGRIYQTGQRDVLVISKLSQIREVDRPKWMSDLYRKHGMNLGDGKAAKPNPPPLGEVRPQGAE